MIFERTDSDFKMCVIKTTMEVKDIFTLAERLEPVARFHKILHYDNPKASKRYLPSMADVYKIVNIQNIVDNVLNIVKVYFFNPHMLI